MIIKTDTTTWINLATIVSFEDNPKEKELWLVSNAPFQVDGEVNSLVTPVRGQARLRVLAWLAAQDSGLAVVTEQAA